MVDWNQGYHTAPAEKQQRDRRSLWVFVLSFLLFYSVSHLVWVACPSWLTFDGITGILVLSFVYFLFLLGGLSAFLSLPFVGLYCRRRRIRAI